MSRTVGQRLGRSRLGRSRLGRRALRRLAGAALAVGGLVATAGGAWAGGAVLAIGGGTEDYGAWSDAPYGWFVAHAGGGHIAVVASSPQSEWIPDYLVSLGAASAENVLIASREDARDPEVVASLQAADGIWFKGGDQSRYLRFLQGTPAGDVVVALHATDGPVGGTSAGCAVLGSTVYDATLGSLDPAEALREARPQSLTFTTDLFGLVPGVVFDTHFTERGRQPRLLAMMAALLADGGPGDAAPLGVGVDHKTALAIEPDGTAEVHGEGAVTFYRATDATAVRSVRGRPPALSHVAAEVLTEGWRVDLSGAAAGFAVLEAPDAAVPSASNPLGVLDTSTVLYGHRLDASQLGAAALSGTATGDALENGTLSVVEGTAAVPRAVVVPRAWDDPALRENTVGGALWALADAPGGLAVVLDAGATLRVDATRGALSLSSVPRAADGGPGDRRAPSVLVMDSRDVTRTSVSPWTAVGASAPRQSAGMEGLTVHLLGQGWTLDWETGVVSEPQ